MLYKCANEACSAPFRRLREGKLFQVETEYFAGHPRRTNLGATLAKLQASRTLLALRCVFAIRNTDLRPRARRRYRSSARRSRKENRSGCDTRATE
jgi:hypothetical protein